ARVQSFSRPYAPRRRICRPRIAAICRRCFQLPTRCRRARSPESWDVKSRTCTGCGSVPDAGSRSLPNAWKTADLVRLKRTKVTWVMERRLRAQFERLLVETVDCADGDAAGALRARLAANVAEGLEEESRAASSNVEDDAEDLARAAAYLDSRLAGSEREAFLASLAASARRRADLASVVALL